jgi:hypothetical protein
MYGYNSTIKKKLHPCIRCGKMCYWFSKKRCQQCSKIEDAITRMEAEADEEIQGEPGLPQLISEADEIFSKWIRKSTANKEGIVSCFTCDNTMRWQIAHCGHYIKRGNLFLRWDTRNIRVQGECCNIYKSGNYPEYTRRLDLEQPGITQILTDEAAIVYKPTREEIKAIILEYRRKFKNL